MSRANTGRIKCSFSVGCVLFAGCVMVVSAGEAGDYEDSAVLDAEEFVAPELRAGPYHRIEERVVNDGFLNTYTVVSSFGTFAARGEDLLRVRVHEVGALAALSEITRSEAFAKALAEAAARPFEAAADVVKDPVGTLKGLPSGVGRYFKRTARKLRKTTDEVGEAVDEKRGEDVAEGEGGEEVEGGASRGDKIQQAAGDAAKKYVGVHRAMREWARKLGVDPYTSNEPLRHELERVASAASVAGLGVRTLTPGIGALDSLGEVDKLVWTTSPVDLEVMNLKRLERMGVGRDLRESLVKHSAYSPSRLTGLVAALHGLEGVDGRASLIERAAAAESEEEAFFFQRSAELLRAYDTEVARIREIVTGEVWGGGITADATLAMPLAVDYLTWSEELATLTASGFFRGREDLERLEMLIAGRVSPRAREELTARGWTIREGARRRWLDR